MRMQSRMEASTRRERALAYAFSQQVNTTGVFSIIIQLQATMYYMFV